MYSTGQKNSDISVPFRAIWTETERPFPSSETIMVPLMNTCARCESGRFNVIIASTSTARVSRRYMYVASIGGESGEAVASIGGESRKTVASIGRKSRKTVALISGESKETIASIGSKGRKPVALIGGESKEMVQLHSAAARVERW